jgi:hypothetical protein
VPDFSTSWRSSSVGGSVMARRRTLVNIALALGALGGDVVGEQPGQELGHPAGVGGRRVDREPALQRLAHLVAARVALVLLGGQRAQDDVVELGRHPRRPAARPQDLGVASPGQQILRLLLARREELAPGQELPQHDRGRVLIAAAVELLAPRLLGRHVRDLAVDDAGRGLLELERRRRQPEVGQLHLARVRDQDVGRRDVAMDQLQIREGVGVGQAAAQLLDDVDRDVDRERDLLLRAAVPDRAQVAALDEVHRQEQLAVDLAGVEHRDQVAVGQLDDDLGLVAEPGHVLGVGQVRQDGLDDHHALEAAVAGDREVQRAHATLGQGSEKVVLPKPPRILVQVGPGRGHVARGGSVPRPSARLQTGGVPAIAARTYIGPPASSAGGSGRGAGRASADFA